MKLGTKLSLLRLNLLRPIMRLVSVGSIVIISVFLLSFKFKWPPFIARRNTDTPNFEEPYDRLIRLFRL